METTPLSRCPQCGAIPPNHSPSCPARRQTSLFEPSVAVAIVMAPELPAKKIDWLADAEPVATARHTDPPTSHTAAASVTDIRETQEAVLRILRFRGPLHDEQMIEAAREWHVAQSESGLRTRRKELVALGLVRDSGKTAKTASGRRTIIWEAV